MEKALLSNQVKEGDKVKILKKYLKGEAKELLDKAEFENFRSAIDCLHMYFKGHKQRIWSKMLDDYETKAKNASDKWPRCGPQEKKTILSRTCLLLNEAEKLAKRDPELAEKVYSDKTVETLMKLNPHEVNMRIVHKTKKKQKELKVDTLSHEKKISLMKDILEDFLEDAIVATGYGDALKETVHSANNMDYRNKKEDRNLDTKNCVACKSSKCNTKWGALGCIKLYKIHEIKERSEFLCSRKLCKKCGQHVRDHWKPKTWTCNTRHLQAVMPARCKGLYNGGRCKFGAAVCEYEDHLPDTATRELLDWIKRHNIKSTVTSILVRPQRQLQLIKISLIQT